MIGNLAISSCILVRDFLAILLWANTLRTEVHQIAYEWRPDVELWFLVLMFKLMCFLNYNRISIALRTPYNNMFHTRCAEQWCCLCFVRSFSRSRLRFKVWNCIVSFYLYIIRDGLPRCFTHFTEIKAFSSSSHTPWLTTTFEELGSGWRLRSRGFDSWVHLEDVTSGWSFWDFLSGMYLWLADEAEVVLWAWALGCNYFTLINIVLICPHSFLDITQNFI